MWRRSLPLGCCVVVALAILAFAAPATAQAPVDPCARPRLRVSPVVAMLASPVVGGAGHFTACQPRTARRLLGAQLVGWTAIVSGGLGLVLTGASRKTVAPFAALSILGVAALLASWASDVYGTITRGRSQGRPAALSRFELAFGYRYLYDPQFAYRNAARLDAEGWVGRTRLFGSAWFTLDDDNQRLSAGVERRLLGERRGSSLALRTALHFHRFGSDAFQSLALDMLVSTRLDLSAIGATLAGSFVEFDLGLGWQGFGYGAAGGGVTQDMTGALLARFGYGFFIGASGELVAYYDHRRDDYAGGFGLDSVASGSVGHVGLSGRGFFGDGAWGASGEIEYGAAVIVGASVLYRGRR